LAVAKLFIYLFIYSLLNIDTAVYTQFICDGNLVTCDVTSDQVTILPGRCRHCKDEFINIFLFRLWGENKADHFVNRNRNCATLTPLDICRRIW